MNRLKKNTWIFLLLLVTEIAIALFHFHKFIRGFVGDVLIIPLLYYFLRFFTKWKVLYLALMILGIAVIIELIQLNNVLEQILTNSTFLQILIGTTFDHKDLLAYVTGFILVLVFEKHTTHE